MTNQLQDTNRTNKFMYFIFPLYVCKRKRKLIYNWTIESRRTNQIFIYLSFQLSWTFAFIQGKCHPGGRSSAPFQQEQRGWHRNPWTHQRGCAQLKPITTQIPRSDFCLAVQEQNKFLWSLVLGNRLYPVTSWQMYQTR